MVHSRGYTSHLQHNFMEHAKVRTIFLNLGKKRNTIVI